MEIEKEGYEGSKDFKELLERYDDILEDVSKKNFRGL